MITEKLSVFDTRVCSKCTNKTFVYRGIAQWRHDEENNLLCKRCYDSEYRKANKNKEIDLSKLKRVSNNKQELIFTKPAEFKKKTEELVKQGKVKVKRIYGVLNIEIEGEGWCSICGVGTMKRIQRRNSRYCGTPGSTPLIRLHTPREDICLCYECVQHMNKSLVGYMASNDNVDGLKKLVKTRLTYDPSYPWRGAEVERDVYPNDTGEIIVRDFTKVSRKRLTLEQKVERDTQKRKAEQAREEAKKDRQHKKDCIRGYLVSKSGEKWPIIGDPKYEHLLPRNKLSREEKLKGK
jgi:hypothetical protein